MFLKNTTVHWNVLEIAFALIFLVAIMQCTKQFILQEYKKVKLICTCVSYHYPKRMIIMDEEWEKLHLMIKLTVQISYLYVQNIA